MRLIHNELPQLNKRGLHICQRKPSLKQATAGKSHVGQAKTRQFVARNRIL
jgi:hypothetical protein